MMGKLKGICISEVRGVQKKEVPEAFLKKGWGIEGDAHGGNWHRQVSLLSYEKIADFRDKGADIDFGAFGENLIIEGYNFSALPVGTCFQIGEAVLQMTQIGKECHKHCEIYKAMGDCIMPREGVFAEVIQEGKICPGDEIRQLPLDQDRPFTAAVITLSDKGVRGEREDKSGPKAEEILIQAGYDVVEKIILADEEKAIKANLVRLADQRQVDLVVTTGGTGFSRRDVTPEATMAAADRTAPGIAEAIRMGSMKYTDRAMLSRGVSVIRKGTLIINLPGSPKAVAESLELVLDAVGHGLGILRGSAGECARK